jgi:DNA-directed RNA polymerase subunit M/transcription elongation factor TFIIS
MSERLHVKRNFSLGGCEDGTGPPGVKWIVAVWTPLWRAVPKIPTAFDHRRKTLAEPDHHHCLGERIIMAKIAKTADRKKIMDTSKSTDCPKCGKPTRIVKRMKDRERNVPGGIFISCSGCEFYEKL